MKLPDRSPGAFMALLFVIVFGVVALQTVVIILDGTIGLITCMALILVGAGYAAKFMGGLLGSEEDSVGAVHEMDVEMLQAYEAGRAPAAERRETLEAPVRVAVTH